MARKPTGLIGFCLGVAILAGCTTVVVRKNPDDRDCGVRFWRPKPYLFIGPLAADPPAKDSSDSSSSGKKSKGKSKPGDDDNEADAAKGPVIDPVHKSLIKKLTDIDTKLNAMAKDAAAAAEAPKENLFTKVQMEVKYLPDYNEEYSIRLTPGLGIGTLNLTLQDGWNLTNVGQTTDQQTSQILGSIATLAATIKPGAAAAGGGGKANMLNAPEKNPTLIIDAKKDVPLGFYEPIIATDPSGKKFLFGWRYVGFMPFSGCPVAPVVNENVVECSTDELWGMVVGKDSIKFQKLSEIRAGIVGYSNEMIPKPYINMRAIKETTIGPDDSNKKIDESGTKKK